MQEAAGGNVDAMMAILGKILGSGDVISKGMELNADNMKTIEKWFYRDLVGWSM